MIKERPFEAKKEPTPAELEKLYEIKISIKDTKAELKEAFSSGEYLRFIATDSFDIWLSLRSYDHNEMLSSNGLEDSNIVVAGYVRNKMGSNEFIHYQDSPSISKIIDKKIIKFLE